MSILHQLPIDEPEDVATQSRIVDITAELQKAYQEATAGEDVTKVLKVGLHEFALADSVSAIAMSKLSEATAGESTRVDLLIHGVTLLVRNDHRAAFTSFLEDEEISVSQLAALVDEMVKVISGKH